MENKEVLVSIIVPTYNVEKYVGVCIDSLMKQTLKNIEIILVDDGSTDSSGLICDEYAKKDSRIKVIHQTNRGLGLSRNSGLKIATGKYIGFVDSDDRVSEDMFQILYRNATECNADISYCTYKKFISDAELKNNSATDMVEIKQWRGKARIHQYMLDRIGLPPQNKKDNLYGASVCCGIFKKQVLDTFSANFVSERQFIAEDMIFDIDVIPQCKCIVHQDIPLYYYRYNPASLTTVYKPDRFQKNIELYHEMIDRLSKCYDAEEYYNSMSRYLLTVARIAIIQEVRFAKKNGIKDTKRKMKEICNSYEVKDVLNKYEYWKLPTKYGVTCFLQKYRCVNLLFWLYKMKF